MYTLQSTNTPQFTKHSSNTFQQEETNIGPLHLPTSTLGPRYLHSDSVTPPSVENNHSNIGESSSLFDSTPEAEHIAIANKCTIPDTPFRHPRIKMVNERSPAKVPLHPVARPNEKQHSQAENTYPAKPPQPQFGQPTMLHSPLSKQKESGVFIQPKARPEHHREPPKPGMLHLPSKLNPV